jgi:hypothetical protein
MLDFGKYSDQIKYGNFNWPIKYKSVGRKIKDAK